jgi:hypothetical protein
MEVKLLALCLGGLENEVADDIRSFAPTRLKVEAIFDTTSIKSGQAGCGKLVVTTTIDVACVLITSCRSCMFFLLYIVHSTNIPTDKLACFESMKSLLQPIDWSNTFHIWRSISNGLPSDILSCHPNLLELFNGSRAPRFSCRCIRDGKNHNFKSSEVALCMGDTIIAKAKSSQDSTKNWVVDLKNMDFSIVSILLDNEVVVGVSIPSHSLPFTKSLLPKEIRPPSGPVVTSEVYSLKPSTAYMMV